MNQYHLPAEWAPQSAVQLTFPHEETDWVDILDEVLPCFIEIAHTISAYQKVLVVCKNVAHTRQLLAKTKHPDAFVFAECNSNDTWARDHGAITVLDGDNPMLLDFVFNGWGLKFPADKDNLISGQLQKAGILGAPIRHGGLVLEGGGIESNGAGTLLTTAECLLSPNRNPHLTKDEIEQQLKQLFGMDQVIWLHHGYLAGDDTDSHIDTLARFCSEDTIAYIVCDDPTDEHFAALKEMEAELKAARLPDGRPFKLVPLPWPEACFDTNGHRLPATYANFLIINGAVLVPTYGVPQDQEALEIIQGLFPDRKTIGINCRALIEQHGSLHCVTMQYPIEVQINGK
jgi:agmatine deiminase